MLSPILQKAQGSWGGCPRFRVAELQSRAWALRCWFHLSAEGEGVPNISKQPSFLAADVPYSPHSHTVCAGTCVGLSIHGSCLLASREEENILYGDDMSYTLKS